MAEKLKFNIDTFNRVFTEYYWDYNVQEDVRALIQYMQILNPSQIVQTKKFIENKKGPSGKIDMSLLALRSSESTRLTENIGVVKYIHGFEDENMTPRDDQIAKVTKEYMACSRFNVLRKYVPNFMYTYGVNAENGEIYFENVKGQTWYDFLTDETINEKQFTSVLVQIAFSLDVMRREQLFHNNLHAKNIILRQCAENVVIEFPAHDGGKYYVPTFGVIATIIDFGESKIARKNIFEGHCNYLTTMAGYDFAKFLMELRVCSIHNEQTRILSQNYSQFILEAFQKYTTNPFFLTSTGEQIPFAAQSYSEFEDRCDDANYATTHNYYLVNCGEKITKAHALEILKQIPIPNTNQYYSKSKPAKTALVLGCQSNSDLCKEKSFVFRAINIKDAEPILYKIVYNERLNAITSMIKKGNLIGALDIIQTDFSRYSFENNFSEYFESKYVKDIALAIQEAITKQKSFSAQSGDGAMKIRKQNITITLIMILHLMMTYATLIARGKIKEVEQSFVSPVIKSLSSWTLSNLKSFTKELSNYQNIIVPMIDTINPGRRMRFELGSGTKLAYRNVILNMDNKTFESYIPEEFK
jgi:hypothetical protein